ncbi:hypothetical protein CMI38_00555 [Candidatus Pacearchaeota archaeon]|jgi:hypothetical protein|nr:hypothetical protein [Candidatus Pacearchaeota archaeon]|tara:strand:+ start:4480 stop:5079 length:600 start_codon:yes stop_codon:yes gene_type:complete
MIDRNFKKKLGSLLMVSLIFVVGLISAQSNLYYVVEGVWNEGEVEINKVGVEVSRIGLDNVLDPELEGYELAVFSLDGKEISSSFTIDNRAIREGFNESGTGIEGEIVFLDEVDFVVYLPYSDEGNKIVIFDGDKNEMSVFELDEFTKEKVVVSEDEGDVESGEIVESEGDGGFFWLFILVGLVVLVLVIYYIVRKRSE